MADVNIPGNPVWKTWEAGANWTIERDWSWHETYAWALEVTEVFGVKDAIKKDGTKPLAEKFRVTDYNKAVMYYTAAKAEAFKAIDAIKFATNYNLRPSETFRVTEAIKKDGTKPFSEKFKVADAILRSGQGILSDLLFEGEGEWTMESLQTYMFKGKHVGYENFKTFVAGDYTYDKALFRTTIDVEPTDRGMIEEWRLTVDVPDVNDRGSAEVVDANFELQVDFNREFHIAPEVVCTVRSGTSSNPTTVNITSITEKYFKVQLVNSITGKPTTGRFIWSATGY